MLNVVKNIYKYVCINSISLARQLNQLYTFGFLIAKLFLQLSGIIGPTGAPLPSQKPPPPPPKNPARLMALALTESANKALRQGASPPYRPRQAGSPPDADIHFQRSLSADAGAMLSSDPDQLYSTVRPLSVWMSESGGEVSTPDKSTDLAQDEEEPCSPPGQVSGCVCVRARKRVFVLCL